ncbi:hypothetical protein QCD60_10875 [Pokkaliibacter sp. MBI-7]|uniref:hypothetical protein n=1 Tax=Pokkaliibacter sp. MBI-7 TaxID=3040600 RepID=UPI00244A1C2C|nr:hypothetical protein [Pokkaliibacter sp. MBI-7]MDH2433072.1 hypothetical protein [Pokkaliibacter sp. MBI-7]
MTAGNSLLNTVHQLMLEEFSTVPFHNLFYLGISAPDLLVNPLSSGGTCSDKVLAFRDRLKTQSIAARLHSAFINGVNCHRVLVLDLAGERYFADVGNAWPSVRLFPAAGDAVYSAYGIEFSSRRRGEWLEIYQRKEGRQSLSLRIPLTLSDEHLVLQKIKHRFDGATEYPFMDGIRFAQVLGDAFVFLKKDRLRIYQPHNEVVTIALPEWGDQVAALETYFGVTLADPACALSVRYTRARSGRFI